MKLRFVLLGLALLGSAGCVTSTNSYTRDIVYRDGSYYSPADDQYGDYYYEPEYDYSYYDDYPYYGYGYYGNSWYGNHDSYQCRFSYHYCDNRWNGFSIGFGGLTLIIGNSNYYGYPYYGYYDPYYYGGYPYYGYYSYTPRPEHHGPTPMQKPRPPFGHVPPANVNGNPGGVRVPGEPILIQTKPALVGQPSAETIYEPNTQIEPNPYLRTRQPRQPVRPEVWRNANDEPGIPVRGPARPAPVAYDDNAPQMRTKPAPVIVYSDDVDSSERPVRQERSTQPYPIDNGTVRGQARPAPAPRIQVQTNESTERAERSERSERTERNDRSERAPSILRLGNKKDDR